METFLFLPFHGFGHFNAVFGLARCLQKNHNVVFGTIGYFANHVTQRGFKIRTLATYPFGLGLEGWIHTDIKKSKYPVWENLIDRWNDKLYHERFAELKKVLEEVNPTHVLVDVQQATDVVVLKAIDPQLRISMISVPPPYLLIPGLPAINSTALPGDVDDGNQQALDAINERVKKQKEKYLGLDDRTMVERRLRRNNMLHLKEIYPSLISLAVKDVDHYVLTYKEFDFHHEYLDKFHYVGAHPDMEFKEPKADYYRKACEDAKKDGKKIVYCSFGTVPTAKNVNGFYDNVSKALEGIDAKLFVTTNQNWAAQQTILRFADVFITHGGMNSVHDAIRYQVPMIVYPIDHGYDQNGNSSRVVFNKLGLRGDFDSATIDDIRSKLIDVFQNRSRFKTLGTSEYSVEKFTGFLTSHN